MSAIRCPSCDRLLARRLHDRSLEVRKGDRLLAVIECGRIYCTICNSHVSVTVKEVGSSKLTPDLTTPTPKP